MTQIPRLEEASPEYARLMSKHMALMARAEAIDSQVRTLHAAMGTEQASDKHGDRVSALLSGVDYRPPGPIKDQLAELQAERRAIDSAIRELAGQIAIEREQASRLVVEQFEGERRRLAKEFFTHVAAAAAAHAAYGDLRRGFHRAGVSPAGFVDFGVDLFGDPGHRNGDVGVAMRVAARKGYIDGSVIPGPYR